MSETVELPSVTKPVSSHLRRASIVENELKLMLLEKKISKKNITFDEDNNIVKMGDYIL